MSTIHDYLSRLPDEQIEKWAQSILSTPSEEAPLMIAEDPSVWDVVQEHVRRLTRKAVPRG